MMFKENSDINELKKIFKYFIPLKKYFIISSMCIVFSVLLSLPIPYLNMILVDKVILARDYKMFRTVLIIWLALLIIMPLFSVIKNYYLALFDMNFEFNVKKDMFSKILGLPLRFFTQHQVGYIQSRIENDVSSLKTVSVGYIANVFTDIIKLIFGLIMMLNLNWKLTIITLFIVPITIINSHAFSTKLKSLNKETAEVWAEQRGLMMESIVGIETVKLFLLEITKIKSFVEKYRNCINTTMKKVSVETFSGYISAIINGLGPFVIWAFGGILVLRNTMTLGQLTGFIGYTAYVIGPAINISSLKLNLQGPVAAWERIEEILNLSDEKVMSDDKILVNISEGKIKFNNVSFSYNDGKDMVLNGFNLNIMPGEKVAILGKNGAGKSTIIKFLLKIYSNYHGEIYIDDRNISEYDIYSLRKQISIVSQESFLFKGTVINNIKIGDMSRTDEEIIDKLKEINIEKFFDELSEGLYTMVEERGANLSGGQKQLISIARALIKKTAKIIILDEATSSIDPLIEKFLRENIDAICKGMTVINIAHKPTFLSFVDKVVVIDSGKVIYEGSIDEYNEKKKGYS